MKQKEYVESAVREHFKHTLVTINSITEFIMGECFCDNCEHNAPNYPWDD